MNYNPLEQDNFLYKIGDIYKIIVENYEDDDWEHVEIKRIKDLDQDGDKVKSEYGGYNYLLKSITNKIEWIIEAGDKNYQGDIFYIGVDEDEKYYFLIQGYGSCSGCDALLSAEYDCQTSTSLEPLDAIRDVMKRNIIQFENLEGLKEYIDGEYVRGSFFFYNDDMKDFVQKINEEFGWCLKLEEDDM